MSLQELLLELLDALNYDSHGRDEHRRRIALAVHDPKMAHGIREALRQLDGRFERYRRDHLFSMFGSLYGNERDEFVTRIRALISEISLPQFVYHGTVRGKLDGIKREGLIPGHSPVWQGTDEKMKLVRAVSDQGVFFATSWRAAMGWADWAHRHSRGRKDSLKRQHVVIRLKADGLSLQPDPAATSPSLVVLGPVPVEGAEVISGNTTSFPTWVPLREYMLG